MNRKILWCVLLSLWTQVSGAMMRRGPEDNYGNRYIEKSSNRTPPQISYERQMPEYSHTTSRIERKNLLPAFMMSRVPLTQLPLHLRPGGLRGHAEVQFSNTRQMAIPCSRLYPGATQFKEINYPQRKELEDDESDDEEYNPRAEIERHIYERQMRGAIPFSRLHPMVPKLRSEINPPLIHIQKEFPQYIKLFEEYEELVEQTKNPNSGVTDIAPLNGYFQELKEASTKLIIRPEAETLIRRADECLKKTRKLLALKPEIEDGLKVLDLRQDICAMHKINIEWIRKYSIVNNFCEDYISTELINNQRFIEDLKGINDFYNSSNEKLRSELLPWLETQYQLYQYFAPLATTAAENTQDLQDNDLILWKGSEMSHLGLCKSRKELSIMIITKIDKKQQDRIDRLVYDFKVLGRRLDVPIRNKSK